MGQRSEDYYRDLIESHQNNSPAFAQGEAITKAWVNGLDKLIEDVKRKANCFENLFSKSEGIIINIARLQELELLTTRMIKVKKIKIQFFY